MSISGHIKSCWLAPAAFLIDRATKAWAMGALVGGTDMDLWPGVLGLTLVRNTGAAFGLLRGRQTLLAAITGVLLLAALVWLLGWGRSAPPLPRAALWLMLGGATGNLYDRIFYGYVVDFIEIQLFSFPVFNVADMAVTVAFGLYAGWVLFGKEWKRDDGRAA